MRRLLDIPDRLQSPLLEAVRAAKIDAVSEKNPANYASDPIAYASDILGVSWWSKQQDIARALLEHRKVFVKASHSVGKTHLAGGLVSWHFDSFDPGITLTTAPTAKQVNEVLWKEVRSQRRGRNMLPKASRCEGLDNSGLFKPDHYAAGYTARDASSFQGRHESQLLVIFDEACGVAQEFWEGAEGMLSSGPENRWLAILNPTDSTSYARQQELDGDWHVVTISALDHPNVAAQLQGLPKPYPKAVDLAWVEEKLVDWCSPIQAVDAGLGDVCWPPVDHCSRLGIAPRWYRPGPLFEGRVLGRWPSQAVNSVWSEEAWNLANTKSLPLTGRLQIGCDVARYGDDDTSLHVRRGGVSLYHESANGWPTTRTADRCKELATEYGTLYGIDPRSIPIAVDDTGVGGGVTDILKADGWNVVPINSACSAPDPSEFTNLRGALWFGLATAASEGRLSFARLPKDVRQQLRKEFLAPTYSVDVHGRRVVESKDRTKSRLGRSPDNADSVMLAYANVHTAGERVAGRIKG